MKDNGPKLKRRHDDLGDRVPNDWLEAVILFVVGLALIGSTAALYHLYQQTL
jgi:hypothetical protein